MSEQREMNLFDLCVLGCKGIGKGLTALWHFGGKAVRLTLRKWWITLPVMALFVGLGAYYSRWENRTFKVNALVHLNGASLADFEQAVQPLHGGITLTDPELPLAGYIGSRTIHHVKVFHAIDVYRDSTLDYIDYRHKVALGDTTIMQDYAGLQFRMKACHIGQLPQVEEALLSYFNTHPRLQAAYEAYLPTLEREVAFNHTQIDKLDSLTSAFYFPEYAKEIQHTDNMVVVGDVGQREITLFLPAIQNHIAYTRYVDQLRSLATAPVVLSQSFTIDPRATNGPIRTTALALIVGWFCGCMVALLIEQRKAVGKWLKK